MKVAGKLFDQNNLPEPNLYPLNQIMNYLPDTLQINIEILDYQT
jgi:hypothetical protein